MAALLFCPRCGSPLERRQLEGRERDVCPACGFIFYRNPVPAVGVVVALDDRIVLVRRKYEPRAGCWGLPAGFMELGESAEEAAVRECYEETSLLVQVDHLLGVYSFGVGQQSGLVIIYAATAVGGAPRAGDDATEVGVFDLNALPAPFAFRSHLQAIERWRREGHSAVSLTLTGDVARELVIRHATRADALVVLDLLLGPQPDEALRLAADALFHDWLHDPDRLILVAGREGMVEGVALLVLRQTLRDWQAALDDLVVVPSGRRRGIGRALVEAAAALARARGCPLLRATPSPGDAGARAFLLACGFTPGAVLTLAPVEG